MLVRGVTPEPPDRGAVFAPGAVLARGVTPGTPRPGGVVRPRGCVGPGGNPRNPLTGGLCSPPGLRPGLLPSARAGKPTLAAGTAFGRGPPDLCWPGYPRNPQSGGVPPPDPP